ncbi:MAG: hypothetical protein IPJ19_18465 [Planctomycetes bacterium]|nr:hypothetical protein [Planctomycetota bacterium]
MMELAFVLCATFTAFAAEPTAQHRSAGQSERVVVTAKGAFRQLTEETEGNTVFQPLQGTGSLWTRDDNGLGWIGSAVSIGNHGSEVFGEHNLNNQRAELFSAFDANPPNAIWSDLAALGSSGHHVASAESASLDVALHTFQAGTSNASCVLSKYTATSGGTPDWTYTFAAGLEGANVAVSRDGSRIVAAASDHTNSSARIAVFGPDSNVPLSQTTIALGGANNGVRGFDLSADGSTLYFSSFDTPVNAYIFNVAAHSVVFTTPINASFDSHAISGNGSIFAFGNFGTLSLYEKIGGVYTRTYTRSVPGTVYCGAIDLSDDGSTAAFGWASYTTALTVQIEALDVPSKTITMTDMVTSTSPGLQNVVSSIACSAKGERFAVGLWGDATGPVAEARVYARNQNAPIVSLDVGGSVYGVAISADGFRAAFSSKSMHANQLGHGGAIDLLGVHTPFTSMCSGNGSLATSCPCGNSGLAGRGCENSASTGGGLLTASGAVAPDSVVLTASNVTGSEFSVVLQGRTVDLSGAVFGDGVRCVSGTLKRLYARNAINGTLVAPISGEPSISARSAALGDPIANGEHRTYQVYYRDPATGFCGSSAGGGTFNITNAVRVNW